jgi:hypothetical protein
MIPAAVNEVGVQARAPRTSGDDPSGKGTFTYEIVCSPHERG